MAVTRARDLPTRRGRARGARMGASVSAVASHGPKNGAPIVRVGVGAPKKRHVLHPCAQAFEEEPPPQPSSCLGGLRGASKRPAWRARAPPHTVYRSDAARHRRGDAENDISKRALSAASGDQLQRFAAPVLARARRRGHRRGGLNLAGQPADSCTHSGAGTVRLETCPRRR